MSRSCILIFDIDPTSYQVLQHAFVSEQTDIRWISKSSEISMVPSNVAIVLYSVQRHEDYEKAYDLHKHFPNAVLFLIAEQNQYDAFEARNAGAVGVFVKPLNLMRVYERLIELLPESGTSPSKGQLDDLFMPGENTRQAKLLSFMPSSPVQDDLEALVEDLLPLVVEQVLRIQLSTSTELRHQILGDIRGLIQEELKAQKLD